MILNTIVIVTLIGFLTIPTVVKWREGTTRRESVTLASKQFSILFLLISVEALAVYLLAAHTPDWL